MVDHVHTLEGKIEQAVQTLRSLTKERNDLKVAVAEKQKRIQELEQLVVSLREGQDKMEAGILNALDRLDAFEDAVHTGTVAQGSAPRAEHVQRSISVEPKKVSAENTEQMEIF